MRARAAAGVCVSVCVSVCVCVCVRICLFVGVSLCMSALAKGRRGAASSGGFPGGFARPAMRCREYSAVFTAACFP